MRISRHNIRKRRGFTLLELVLAIGLLALLVGMIFAVATQNIALGNAVVQRQNEESEQSAFIGLLSRKLAQLPGNARLQLISEDSGSQYTSEMTIQNVPVSFNWGGTERIAKAIQLVTEKRRSGNLDIVMKYYENEILDDEDQGASLAEEPFAEVTLLREVRAFEWQVYDGRLREWMYDWEQSGRLPLRIELVYAMSDEELETPVRHVFWLAPKQNPEVVLRQLQRGGGQEGVQGGAGEGESGQSGDGREVQVPATQIRAAPRLQTPNSPQR